MMLPKLRFASSNPKKVPSLCAGQTAKAGGEYQQGAPPKQERSLCFEARDAKKRTDPTSLSCIEPPLPPRATTKSYGADAPVSLSHIFVPAGRQDGICDPGESDEERRLSSVRHDIRWDGVLKGKRAKAGGPNQHRKRTEVERAMTVALFVVCLSSLPAVLHVSPSLCISHTTWGEKGE